MTRTGITVRTAVVKDLGEDTVPTFAVEEIRDF